MTIDELRRIGRRLLTEVEAERRSPIIGRPLGTGAAGDKTFPVDRRAEDVILAGLKELDQPLTVISEEAGVINLKGGGTTVIVDPVDGSKNAISGIPFFCASIGVAEGGSLADLRLAYVVHLVTGDEFWAEKGSGAYLNGRRLTCQEGDEFSLIAYESPSPARDLPALLPLLSQARKTRCFGATALDLAFVALGAASVFVTASPSRSFDFAAGWLLVKEAGGIVTDSEGNDIGGVELSLKRSVALLAAGNPVLHRKALKHMGKVKGHV